MEVRANALVIFALSRAFLPEWLLSMSPHLCQGAVLGGKLAAEVIVDKTLGRPTPGVKEVQQHVVEAAASYGISRPRASTRILLKSSTPFRSTHFMWAIIHADNLKHLMPKSAAHSSTHSGPLPLWMSCDTSCPPEALHAHCCPLLKRVLSSQKRKSLVE